MFNSSKPDVVLASEYFEILKNNDKKRQRYKDEWEALRASYFCSVSKDFSMKITLQEMPLPLTVLKDKDPEVCKELKMQIDAFLFALRSVHPNKKLSAYIKADLAYNEVAVEHLPGTLAKKPIALGNKATACYLQCRIKNEDQQKHLFESDISFINEVPSLGKSLEIWSQMIYQQS